MMSHINIGTGEEISIAQLAYAIKEVVAYTGMLKFDPNQPDGTPRKLLNSQKLQQLGWKAKYQLKDGLKMTYDWYRENEDQLRQV
jgi:GDP-L-fucose synthase